MKAEAPIASGEPRIGPQPFPDAPPSFAVRLVLGLRRMLLSLADALSPARLVMFEMSTGGAVAQLIRTAARKGIPDILGNDWLGAKEIASRIGSDPDLTFRMMRALAHARVFAMDGEGRFANTRLSHSIRSGTLEQGRAWVDYFGSKSNVDAWGACEHTLMTGDNSFREVHGTHVWDWFDRHPGERETFAKAMMGITTGTAPLVAALYPFREVRTVCDLGGGRGTLLSELLVRHRHLRGILCEAEGILPLARELFEARGVNDRVELVAGSFFAELPRGADAYILKNILHDWDDERCRAILGQVRRAMRPDSRVLLVEAILEKNDFRNIAAFVDVQMAIACENGRERSLEELRALLESAGFIPARVYRTSTDSIVEGLAAR